MMFFNEKTINHFSRFWKKHKKKIRLKQTKKKIKEDILWASKRGWFEMTVYIPIQDFSYIESYLLKKGFSIEVTGRRLDEDYQKAVSVRWGENKDDKNL